MVVVGVVSGALVGAGGLVAGPVQAVAAVPAVAVSAGPTGSAGSGVSRAAGRGRAPFVKVRGVTVSARGSSVSATVAWNKKLIRAAGHRDRLDVHLVARKTNGRWVSLHLSEQAYRGGPTTQTIRIKLNAAKAKILRTASTADLTVTQQHDSPTERGKRFDINYVTVTRT